MGRGKPVPHQGAAPRGKALRRLGADGPYMILATIMILIIIIVVVVVVVVGGGGVVVVISNK